MIENNFPRIDAGKRKLMVLFAVFFISLISFCHGEKKEMRVIDKYEKIDPLDEKVLDFLDMDYDQLRRQAGQFAGEKKYFEAARCYLALLKFNRNDLISIYNLACCYGRLRKADLAVKSLAMAIRAGFRNFELLEKDRDFDLIRDAPEFVNLLAHVPDWEESLGEVLYIKTSKLVELLVKLPRKYSPSLKYPLLIGLHGNGGNPEQMLTAMTQALKKEPVILAAPQGAYPNFPQIRGQHFSWEIQTQNRELWKIGDPLAVENINEAVQMLMKKYPISEVYILGFSQGAAYAFLSGFKYPGLAAGIISIGGLFPESDTEFSVLKEAEIENGKKFRVFIAQGGDDLSLPAGLGAGTAEKLKKFGYDVKYQEYEGGHEISPVLLKKIYAWMAMRKE
jgi:phospholipase/carboxylesterase